GRSRDSSCRGARSASVWRPHACLRMTPARQLARRPHRRVGCARGPPLTRCIVVVPTYNECENLPVLVPRVLAQSPSVEVLIVDDDSPDGTGKLADDLARSDARVHVLHRARKEGLGPAYRAGFRQALDLGADVVVQMDADFSHPPETLPRMLEEIEHCDVVQGSRYLTGITVVNWPIERILLSYFGNLYVRTITGLPLTDTTSGFR